MILEEINTQRLILRKLTPEVYAYLFSSMENDQIIEYLQLSDYQQLLKEKEKLAHGISTYNRSFVYFLIFEKVTQTFIGSCGFHTWYIDHFRAEIGYSILNDRFKNMGIMSEAIETIISYGFDKMNLNRIEALVGPTNIPSLKLMNKFNFIQEGHLRSHYFKNNTMEDSIVFSLLKNEYKR